MVAAAAVAMNGEHGEGAGAVALTAAKKNATSTSGNSNERTIEKVVLGDILFSTWYPSFYPEELLGPDKKNAHLYICSCCFKYSREIVPYISHLKQCNLANPSPPGRLVYSKDSYSVYEVDGSDRKLFCQNLCLFAKLFLDNKSVFYDVTTFLYYLLVFSYPNPQQPSLLSYQVIGFFSKEKMSWDQNNLACILVFPPWQRKGLGKILMGVSYELSKREQKIGGPEKPLSDLGRRGYLSFWSSAIAYHFLSQKPHNSKKPQTISIKTMSDETFILPEDILYALKEMNIIDSTKRKTASGAITVTKGAVRDWVRRNHVDVTPPVDVSGFAEDFLADITVEAPEVEAEE